MKKKIVVLLIPVLTLSFAVGCGLAKNQSDSGNSRSASMEAVRSADEEAMKKAAALYALNTAPTSVASSSSEESPKAPSAPEPASDPEPTKTSETTPAASEYPTVVNGIAVSFRKSIANDKTGKWRVAVVIDDMSDPDDYILDFYKAYIKDPSEVFAIVNKKTKTTIRINHFLGDWLDVGFLTYKDGEEIDAKKLFTGELIDSYLINTVTGEVDFQE